MQGAKLRLMTPLPIVLLLSCAPPRAVSWNVIEANPALSQAASHVALGVLVRRNGEALAGNDASLVVLDNGLALTAAHCVAEWNSFFSSPSDDGSLPFDMIVHRHGRSVQILDRGDPQDPLRDWALLSVPWEPGETRQPVVQKTIPVVGESVFLVGFPGSYVGSDWVQPLFDETDVLHPQRFDPPFPVMLHGVVSKTGDNRFGIVVKMQGKGPYDLGGISGGPAFVIREGKLAIIGIISRNRSTPFRRDVTLTPIDNIPVVIPAWQEP